MYTVDETYKNIEAEFKPRSKWGHGVKDTALAYSYGGCALVYNVDIAARFFTPSEMRRYMANGHDASMAFRGEPMLDLQARALRQAERVISRYAREH